MLAILNFNEEYICSTNGTPQEGGKLQPVYVIFFFFPRQTDEEFGQKAVTLFIWLEVALLYYANIGF